jgi:AcrR family transcriptional regulator
MVKRETRRERERRQHRREILDAARKLFAQKGFGQTTVAEIAEAAEFSVGTLYNFFDDKEDLYRSIVLEIAGEIHQAVTTALTSRGTEVEKIERLIEVQTALLAKHAAVGRFYFEQGMGTTALAPTAALDQEMGSMYAETLKQLQALFRSGIRKGRFLNVNPLILALLLEALVNGFIPILAERPDAFSADEMANAVKTVFFEQVRL